MRTFRRWAGFGMIGAILLLAATPALSSGQQPRTGAPAPDFILPSLGGDTTRLSDYHGHPVVLKFWATWCPTCRTELPELLQAQREHGAEGLVVITVDSDDKPTHIRHFLATIDSAGDLPVLVDRNRRVQDRYRIPLLPTTVFIDSAGVIQGIHAGAIRQAELAEGLRRIM